MKRILVIGAGAYQIPLIQRIIETGNLAYCVDGNPNAQGFLYATESRHIDVLDQNACLAYAKEIRADAVMTYGATLTLSTVSYVGRELNLPVLPMDTAEISKSKFKIKKRLAEYGCNIKGDFFEMYAPEDAQKHEFPKHCVIKPSDGSGSKGVSLVYDESQLHEAIAYAYQNARYGEFYAESLIDGEEFSVETFVCNGQIFVYAIVKTTFEKNKATGEISYGHRTPSGLSDEQEKLIEEEVKKAVKALNITMGSANFDIILSNEDGKPYIIDCGIRIGQNLIASHLVPLSRGVSVLDNTIKLALGEKVDGNPKHRLCVATRLLIYKPGTITEIKDTSDLIGKHGIADVVMRKKVGDVQNEYKEKSDTCGWVITTGKTPQEAEENAKKAKKILESYIIIQ